MLTIYKKMFLADRLSRVKSLITERDFISGLRFGFEV